MYKKGKGIPLKSSSSLLSNNLCVLLNREKGITNYAAVHKSTVNIVSMSNDGSSVNHRQVVCKDPAAGHAHGGSMILQAKWVQLVNRTVLVITSQKGIQIFESDGSTIIYWHALGDVNSQEIQPTFARGICGLQDDLICVGSHTGEIFVFSIPAKGTNVTTVQVLQGHRSAICDLASEGEHLVSSDEHGEIIVWAVANENLQELKKINGPKYPCSTLAVWNGVIVGGYGSGHIRVFSLSSGKMSAEVTAHAQWINAIHITKETGLCLSVGEDSFARVWQLKPDTNPQIEHKHSEHVADMQLVGGQFTTSDGRSFCVTGYDSNELVPFFK